MHSAVDVVYNFADTLLKYLKYVLQCLNGNFNTGYNICVICVWGALVIINTLHLSKFMFLNTL